MADQCLNVVFSLSPNAPCNNAMFNAWRIPAMEDPAERQMHASAARLYQAAKALRKTEGQSAVARLLNESAQTVNNWESRGVSKAGALTAQTALGCSATWLLTGEGSMTVVSTPAPASLFGASEPWVEYQQVPASKYRYVPVVGQGVGGAMPERIWTDADYPVGLTDEYAEVTSPDPHAFIIRVVGSSMVPKYTPGDYALVEPGTEPELEDDVLVRLQDGQTLIKRLLSRRGGYVRLGSYNADTAVLIFEKEQVTWMYYVAFPVPARKIKSRV